MYATLFRDCSLKYELEKEGSQTGFLTDHDVYVGKTNVYVE